MKKTDSKKTDGAQGLKVHEPVMMPLGDIQMAPYNPRIMPKDKMDALKASLVKHGLVLNLVVQRRSEQYGANVLVGGHQRVKAMREICAARGWQVPAKGSAIVLDLTDSEAKQLNVSLNNIEGEFDPYKLGEMFADIRPTMTMDDVLASGFTAVQLDEMVALTATPDEQAEAASADVGGLGGFGSSITLSIEFDTVEQRDAAKDVLRNTARDIGKKPGVLVLELLKAAKATGKLAAKPGGKDAGARARKAS